LTPGPGRIFLITGLLTVVTAPVVYLRLEDNVSSARFLTAQERAQALERLRANQTGVGSRDLNWQHIVETLQDIKSYFFAGIAFTGLVGAQLPSTFGPLILTGFGFDKYMTTLLSIPFGAFQCLVMLAASWAAVRLRWKSPVLVIHVFLTLTGLVLLFTLPRDHAHLPALLLGYYLLAFNFACPNLNLAWTLANTAGQTKKSATLALLHAASAVGAIVGPLLFDAADAPEYRSGLRSTMGIVVAMFAVVLLQAGDLMLLNRLQARRRVGKGKPAHIHDHSMEFEYVDMRMDNTGTTGDRAFADLTDRRNDEFVYVY
jgi:hypothetical protein